MVKVYIETTKGRAKKYELRGGKLKLDQVLPKGLKFPVNYGFVPGTKAADKDKLDVILVSKPLKPKYYDVRVVGALKMRDRSIRDDKIVTVLKNSRIKKLKEIKSLKKIEKFFANYKGKEISIIGWAGKEEAERLVRISRSTSVLRC